VVVADPEKAIGFRLSGVEAFEASDPKKAEEIVSRLIMKGDTGIVAVDEFLLMGMDEKVRSRIDRLRRPIIIPIPSRAPEVDRRSYIERLLRKAIGYNIVMRR
jgi:V/A-type H+/Na+-transporting ATPase subunit F